MSHSTAWDPRRRLWVLDGAAMTRDEAIVALQRTAKMSRATATQCLDNHLPLPGEAAAHDSAPADGAVPPSPVEQDALF